MKTLKLSLCFTACIIFAVCAQAQYSSSSPIFLDGASNITISAKEFKSGSSGASILLKNCKNIKIINCRFINIPSYVGIQMQNCSNVEVVDCYFDTFKSGVYAISSSGINVHCNSFKTIVGPVPRGQIVQFNGVQGAGNRINYNILEHVLGTGQPEDLINAYASSGIASDPLQIIGNKLRGGGPSKSGGGIMVGDNGGHDILVADNILVDPGQYGIGAPAGYNITIRNNKLFAKQQAFTNVGIYVGLASEISAGFACTGSTIRVEGNQVNWTNKNGVKAGYWNCSCCPGVVLVNNNFNAPISSSILPSTISLDASKCSSSEPVNQAPVVSISSPANNATFTAPANISLAANATDADGTISKVEFYNGSTLLNSDVTAPFSFTWSNVAAGTYTITAKATDNKNAVASSSAITIKVNPATTVNKLPLISFETPLNNSNFNAPADMYIKVNASDEDGSISNVKLYKNGTFVRQEGLLPYEWGAEGQNDPSIKGLLAGTYVFKAVATDNEGGTSTAEITVTVKDPVTVNQSPVLSVLSPANNASFVAPATVNISASASDNDGTIAKVEFFNGGSLLSTDVAAPYSYSWSNVAAGTYTIIVKATDNKGAVSSKSVSVIVNPAAPTFIGINGPSCVNAGATYTFTLNPDNNATTVQWWSNSGATTVQDNADPKKVSVQIPSYMNGSSFTLISGVNFSVSPWYKEYSKTIKVGGCAAKILAVLSPHPTEDNSILSMENNERINSVIIYNTQGAEVCRVENIGNDSFPIGTDLAAGIYILHVQSEQGLTVAKFIKK